MSYYPIFLELSGRRALVVGGGTVARRKIETLLDYGASVGVISRNLSQDLNHLVKAGKVTYLGPVFSEEAMDGAFLVIAATDDKELNHRISKEARRREILVNAVDQPSDCDFIVPSIVKRGDLLIAISTSGKSPALAKSIRRRLQAQFGQEYDRFLRLMGALRKEVLRLELSQEENSRIFNGVVNSDLMRALAEGDKERVETVVRESLPEGLEIKDLLKDLWSE